MQASRKHRCNPLIGAASFIPRAIRGPPRIRLRQKAIKTPFCYAQYPPGYACREPGDRPTRSRLTCASAGARGRTQARPACSSFDADQYPSSPSGGQVVGSGYASPSTNPRQPGLVRNRKRDAAMSRIRVGKLLPCRPPGSAARAYISGGPRRRPSCSCAEALTLSGLAAPSVRAVAMNLSGWLQRMST